MKFYLTPSSLPSYYLMHNIQSGSNQMATRARETPFADFSDESFYFVSMQKDFSFPQRFVIRVTAVIVWADMKISQVDFTLFDEGI